MGQFRICILDSEILSKEKVGNLPKIFYLPKTMVGMREVIILVHECVCVCVFVCVCLCVYVCLCV